MTPSILIALGALLVAILAHAASTIWWASHVSTTLNNIHSSLLKMDKEFEKRDAQISKLWDRVDAHSEVLASHAAVLKQK